MKKITFLLLTTLFSYSYSYSQGTLEHTYSSGVQKANMSGVLGVNTANGFKYYTFNRSTNLVEIYNQSHVLETSFTIPLDAGHFLSEFIFVTDKLFNNDNQIEFLYKSYKTGDTDNKKMYLCNDTGVLLQSFPGKYYAGIVKDNSNNYKMIVSGALQNPATNSYDYDVYGLTGTLSTEQQDILTQKTVVFPNPSNNVINISNTSNTGRASTLQIFSADGKKVLEEKHAEEEIKIDVSALQNGVYIYKLGDKSGKFIKN
ncbi:T9SS type A sorting domain-containing protein [Flavobacterium ajazii]|uniref:T9SS type A sorting domain-containing protein n=1 Tax=Flavobacterium ajazii TaxID=2692318 RepID=UPI0013D5A8AD|nr:T9SS type A sorting domain-containing protein [Flavobacterium ajazii]